MSAGTTDDDEDAIPAWLADLQANLPSGTKPLTKEEEEELLGYDQMMPIEPNRDDGSRPE